MGKFISFTFILFVGTALGFSARRPNDPSFVLVQDLPSIDEPYIYGGEKVQGREFPGQVSVQLDNFSSCGGSIVNVNYILTAAHCSLRPPESYIILSGTNNLKKGGTKHKVTEIHYHEEYSPEQFGHNDLAVMKVDPPFVFDPDNITAPVSLPAQNQTTPIGTRATVIGWGERPISHGEVIPDDLYKVDIFIWNHTLCEEAYIPMHEPVYPEEICANTAEGGEGSCRGDSGGPLFVDGEVVGLVSWALDCAMKRFPTVYTRVSAYREWIDSKINA